MSNKQNDQFNEYMYENQVDTRSADEIMADKNYDYEQEKKEQLIADSKEL